MSSPLPMRVFPPAVEFHGIEVGTMYFLTISIQNTGSTVRRVRFRPPSTAQFSLTYEPGGSVAPGMDTTAEISFEADEETDYHDKIEVVSGTSRIVVPLRAFAPSPAIEFDGFVDLGVVVAGNSAGAYVEFRNLGLRRGHFDITFADDMPITVSPASATLESASGGGDSDGGGGGGGGGDEGKQRAVSIAGEPSSSRVKVTFQAQEGFVGPFRCQAKVEMPGQSTRVLDINATVVEHRLELVLPNGGGSVNALPFGTEFFGRTRTIDTLLVNNGPEPLSFVMDFEDEDAVEAQEGGGGGEDGGSEAGGGGGGGSVGGGGGDEMRARNQAKIITASIMEGSLMPYSEIPVTFTFRPMQLKAPEVWRAQPHDPSLDNSAFTVHASVECPETNQSIAFAITGTGTAPLLDIAPKKFSFGECPCNGRRDIVATISNKGGELPIDFNINAAAHFRCHPSRGRLNPMQSIKVVFSFLPSQLGQFRQTLHLVALDGATVLPLKVSGKSSAVGPKKEFKGGPDCLPDDFKPKLRFVRQRQVEGKDDGSGGGGGGDGGPEYDDETQRSIGGGRFVRVHPWEESLAFIEQQERVESKGGTKTSSTVLGAAANSVAAADAMYTYSLSDLSRRQAHRDQFKDYLVATRMAREKKTTSTLTARLTRGHVGDTDDPVGIDLGMAPRGGLSEPQLKLPEPAAELWLDHPLGEPPKKSKGRAAPDPTRLIRKKFKPQPSTPAEVRDCGKELTGAELSKVVFLSKTLEFGRVSVQSATTLSFNVSNELETTVLFACAFEDEELHQSTPSSQVVPPGSVAGFDVIFSSRTEQNYTGSVVCTINGQHHLKFHITAEVVPIMLSVVPEELTLQLRDDEVETYASQAMTIENEGNAEASFQWQPSSTGAFYVHPPEGLVGPGEKLELQLTFEPTGPAPKGSEGVYAETLTYRVEDGLGLDGSLHCTGEVSEGKCAFVEKKLQFGRVAVGLTTEKTLTLKNTGKDCPAVFTASTALPEVVIEPEQGLIPVGESIELRVKLTPTEPNVIDKEPIRIAVRGGKNASIRMDAEAMITEVSILEDEFLLGGVVVGVDHSEPFTLRNEGVLNATMYLDFSAQPDFSVAFAGVVPITPPTTSVPPSAAGSTRDEAKQAGGRSARGRGAKNADEDGETKGQDDAAANAANPRNFEEEFILQPTTGGYGEGLDGDAGFMGGGGGGGDTGGNGNGDGNGEGGSSMRPPSKYQLIVPAYSVVELRLVYAPTREGKVSFELPLQMAGLPGLASLRRVVVAEGLRARLHLSRSLVDFGSQVISRDRIKNFPYHTEVEMTSQDEDGFNWSAGSVDLDGTTFSVEPSEGHLEPGESRTLRLAFLPEQDSETTVTLPLYVDGKKDRPYLNVHIRGTGMYPRLCFDVPEVVMPTVPLGMESKATFYVINRGYDNLELKHKLPPDNDRVPIKLTFPEGTTVGIAKERVRVDVAFTSRKAISFNAKIYFMDTEGNRFDVQITGTTDNCVLTTHDFVTRGLVEYDFYATGKDKAVNLLMRNQIADLRTDALQEAAEKQSIGGRSVRPDDARSRGGRSVAGSQHGGDAGKGKPVVVDPSVPPAWMVAAADELEHGAPATKGHLAVLLQFLNGTLMKTPIARFPQDLAEGNGKAAVEMVEMLTGKNLSGKASRLSTRRRDRMNQLMSQYDALLSTLIAQGALLHEVRSEALLSRDTYEAYRADNPGNAGVAGGAHKLSFDQISLRAWAQLMHQIIKLFVLARITPRQLQSLPGMENAPPECMGLSAPTPPPADAAAKGGRSSRNAPRDDNPQAGAGKKKKRRREKTDPAVSSSNVYSTAEMLLLRWLGYHYNRLAPTDPRNLVNLTTDLADGSVLCHLMMSHIPSLAEQGRPLFGFVRKPSQEVHEESNANKIIAALAELGLDIKMDPKALRSPDAPSSLLFVLYLYHHLPQFVPKAIIAFPGALGETVGKSIELRNPSANKPVDYWVTLEGCGDFQVAARQLRLEPQEVVAYPIEFTSRFSSEVAARLTFTGSRAGGASAATMVFTLKSAVHSRVAVSTTQCMSRTYEPVTVEVEITNPFKSDCTFQLSLAQDFKVGDKYVPLQDGRPAVDDGESNSGRGKGGKAGGGARGAGAVVGAARSPRRPR